MPVINEGATVLLTGATGFIATQVVGVLLSRGFRVRGTVRTTEKGEYVKSLFKQAGDRFEYVIVEDLQKDDGFNDAVRGVDGILHVASPLYRTAPTGVWENIIEPAKRGTTSVLYAALRHNPNVKRIVITSSYQAVANYSLDPGTMAKEYALKMGKDLDPVGAYAASKAMAEEVAWEFMKTEKPSFDIVAILPPLVCGPILQPGTSPNTLNTSNFELWQLLTGNKEDASAFVRNNPTMPIVDVRDVALAHVEALLHPNAGNRRIAVTHSVHRYQELLDVIHDVPQLADQFPNASWGEPGTSNYDSLWYDMDATLSKEILGIEYRDWKETIIDATKSMIERGKEQGWKMHP
ncbi:hypothetical protein BDZ94DRAFT_1305655 [Collybia nuda]|uniref:NAD-dependent epimerase/dehydratase domain-containing protein n=1 Tax=Collybia nuda TaxID=64659 RepID=A0A9P5YER7_9AGAR|nr:hypothetical protein BDZ94DRAFT_1305655 [Collybia nuda]